MDLTSQKTMAQGSKEVGREVPVTMDIPTNKLEKLLGADAYAEFPASTTISFETYDKRASTLADALGNKDSVKG